MDAAALLLISAVGVAFGWRPMPDGSQQYEYIVQLEPELAQTLADGRSIPIVSDVPPEVEPIGRIRVVVGREAPPRQRLVTRLKPATGGDPQDSTVQLAQFNRYADDRYTAAPAQQPPTAAAATDRLAANPDPYGAVQSRSAPQDAGESAWNTDQADPPITPTGSTPPSGQQLFGQSSAAGNPWNADAAIDSAAKTASQTASQLGRQLQQNAQPLIQEGARQIDSQVQAAADKFGNRTRDLVNELRQPLQQPQLPANTQQGAAASATASTNEQAWNQEDEQAAAQNPPRGDEQAGATWNNQQQQTSQPDAGRTAATPGSAGQSSPPIGSAAILWNTPTAGQSASSGAGSTTAPQQPGADPWAGVPDPRTATGAAGPNGAASTVPGVATRPMPFGGLGTIGTPVAGPQFPNAASDPPQPPPAGQTASAQPGTGAAAAASQGAPEVRSHMLQQPGDRPLDGATAPGAPASAATTAATTTPSGPAGSTWGVGGQNPAKSAATASNVAAPTGAESGAAPPSRDNTVAILFAWVMLSGSVAGNFYLFWSYLDVRQKYRSLVRKTARAVGSRFSAA